LTLTMIIQIAVRMLTNVVVGEKILIIILIFVVGAEGRTDGQTDREIYLRFV
jgi:hypothetical protein